LPTGPRPAPKQFGRFEVLRELGRGGCGIVYLAVDPTLRRRVALKVPRPEALHTPELHARFVREAKATAGLDHPHIVPVHEAGALGPVWYIASAYCEGPTLAAWLREQQSPVPARTAASLVAVLAGAVQHAHSRGILHRDLKPANILLSRPATESTESTGEKTASASSVASVANYVPKITDFGLAKVLETDLEGPTLQGGPAGAGAEAPTRSGVLLGTPRYMAPEQAEGRSREIGPPADVYALGAILYEVLAGRPPFEGATDLATLRLVLSEDPLPLRRLRPDVSRDLEAICLKCLEKEPRRRYASAALLAADLERFLRGEPTQARPAGAARRALKWARRRPAAAALVGVSALALLGLLAGAAWHSAEQHRSNTALARTNADLEKANAELREAAAREQQQALHLRRLLYANELKLVLQAWQKGQPAQAVEWLDALRPRPGQDDLRGFEWYYLKGRCHPFHAVWRGHQGSVDALAVSADGQTVASAGRSRALRLWDVATGQTRAVLAGHAHPVDILALSPDGQVLASGGGEGRDVRLWDLTTGKERARFTVGAHLGAFAFTPDGKQLAVGSADGVKFWEVATGQPATGFLKQPTKVLGLAIAPDGRTIATGNEDGTVRLWDVASGRQRRVLRGHDELVRCVAFAPDGLALASGGWQDGKVNLWDLAAGQLRATLGGPRCHVRSVAFTPDGRALAASTIPIGKGAPAGAGEIKLWDVATGAPLPCAFERAAGQARALAFLPGGRLLVVGCTDNTVKLLDTGPRPKRQDLPGHAPAETWALAFAPDGRALASAGDDHLVRLWDARTGRQRAALQGHEQLVSAVAFSPDGRTVASASYDQTAKLWGADTGRLRATLTGTEGPLRCLAFAPDGRTLATGGHDNAVRLWGSATGRALASLTGHAKAVRGVAFSPDGTMLASGGEDGKVQLWDTTTRQPRCVLDDTDQVHCLAFAPDGKALACGNEVGVVRLWDVATGRERAALKGHVGRVYALAFAPDGRTLATAGDDKTVRLWQAATGEEVLALEGHATRVNAVAFAPDGQALASASHDGKVTLWRTAPRNPARR
jgi:WD40 repeat protein